MGWGADTNELRELVRTELAARLKPAGWVLLDPARSFKLAELVGLLDADLAATATVVCGEGSGRGPLLISAVFAGVSYEPLRHLSSLLGDNFRLELLHDAIDDQLERNEEDDCLFAVGRHADVAHVAESLAQVILKRGLSVAERYPALDDLLQELEAEGADVRLAVPALLAAAGRFDDARDALARYEPLTGHSHGDRDARRIVHQLTRYIDSGGDPTLVPAEPPPDPHPISPMKPVPELWRQGRARQQAVDAVRRLDPATDRAELHEALERELAARGLTESPLWYEQTLDHLHDTRAEQAERLANGVKTAARLGFKAFRALREHRPPPDLSVPAWLEPPDRAAYAVPRRQDAAWAAVQLDDGARAWLDTSYEAIPRLFGSVASADAWLDWDDRGQERLVASLGDQRIGTLDLAATEAYRETMTRAAERDELPYAPARITPRPVASGYLVELQLPVARARA
jgi:hypothetical protein